MSDSKKPLPHMPSVTGGKMLMPEVINNTWKPPPQGENQWCVMIGGVRLTVNALSHQKAKSLAIDYLSACCGDPLAYRNSIVSRISKKWRGGIKAKLRHRGHAEDSGDCQGYCRGDKTCIFCGAEMREG